MCVKQGNCVFNHIHALWVVDWFIVIFLYWKQKILHFFGTMLLRRVMCVTRWNCIYSISSMLCQWLTPSYDSFICTVLCLFLTFSHVWHDSILCETWREFMCVCLFERVEYDCEYMTSANGVRQVVSAIRVCRIQRLFYRALLQKRPIILRSQLIECHSYSVFRQVVSAIRVCRIQRLFYRALLQKRPIILRSLLIECHSYSVFRQVVSTIRVCRIQRLFYRALLQKRPILFKEPTNWANGVMGWLRLVGSIKL